MPSHKKFLWLLILLHIIVWASPKQSVISQSNEMLYPVQLSLGTINSARWQPNGDIIAVGGSQGVRLYTSEFEFIKQLSSKETELIVWNPTGTKVAGLSRGQFTLWDATSGIAEFSAYGVSCPVTFSPDGNFLALGSDGGEIRVINAFDGTFISLYRGQQVLPNEIDVEWTRLELIAWSPDGSEIISFGSGMFQGIHSWNPQTGQFLREVTLEGFLHDQSCANRVAWSPDYQKIFNVTDDDEIGTAAIWDIQNGRVLAATQEAMGLPSTVEVVWSPDGTKLLSYEAINGDFLLWDATNLSILRTFQLAQPSSDPVFQSHSEEFLFNLDWSPDSANVLFSSVGGASIVDVETGHITQQLQGYTGWANELDWSPDGKYLATAHGSQYGYGDNRIRIWDTTSGTNVATCLVHTGSVNDVVWSPTGNQLASAAGDFNNADGSLRIWDAATCEQLAAVWSGTIVSNRVEWKSDGTQLSRDGMTIYNADLSLLMEFPFYGTFMQWSPDGQKLAIVEFVDNPTLRIYQASDFALLTTITDYTDSIRELEWSPDGNEIASIDASVNTIIVTDISSGNRIFLSGHRDSVQAISWNTQRNLLASAASDNTIGIWDMTSRADIAIFENQEAITDLAWNPAGTMLASVSDTGAVTIWQPHQN